MQSVSEPLGRLLEQRGIHPEIPGQWDVETLADAFRTAGAHPRETLPVQARLYGDDQGYVVAVVPFGCSVSEGMLRGLLERPLTPRPESAGEVFPECDSGFLPPLGMAYGVTTIVDHAVLQASAVIMATGVAGALMKLESADLRRVLAGTAQGAIIDDDLDGGGNGPAMEEMAKRLQSLYRLPPMPAIALRVMQMTAAPDTSAAELAAIIERDPSLAAQVLRYARSALFNYRGELRSVQEAVTRVLGFDRVAHLAVGIAASRSFSIPAKGALGLENFWRHSLHCARLCQAIARTMPKSNGKRRVDPEMAYLCGLLHNLGLLLIGHLFPEDFRSLNERREEDLSPPLHELEQAVFTHRNAEEDGLRVGHAAAGSILLRLWEMPDAVVRSAGLHESSSYQGEGADYVHIVQLGNELLKPHGIGDEFSPGDAESLAGALDLTPDQLERLSTTIDDVTSELDELARGLAA